MTYRRTWFSCVLWFLYTVLCIGVITFVSDIWLSYFTGFYIHEWCVLLVIPVAVLYWIIRVISTHIRKKRVWKEHNTVLWECIVAVLILVVALVARIMVFKYAVSEIDEFIRWDSNLSLLYGSSEEYYDMAMVTSYGIASPMDRGVSYLYVTLLSVVLSFLGNKFESAMVLQIILQMIGLILVYAVTRKMTRRLPAWAEMFCLAVSWECMGGITIIVPEWLFFDLYMLGMLAVVTFVKNYCDSNISRPLAVACSVGLGVLIGVLAYLDLTGASLLVMILIAAVGKKTESEAIVYYNHSKGMNATVIVCTCLCCAAAWFSAMYAAAYVGKTSVVNDIWNKLRLCYQNSFPFGPSDRPHDWRLIGVLIVFAFFLVLEYFRSGREQNYMPWILLCLVVAPTPMTAYGDHGFSVLSLYLWAVLAGLGLQNCLFGGRAKVMQAVTGEINLKAETAEQTAEVHESGAMEGQASKPRYIENPLPLPKKHVAREMDYQYDVAEKDMKYDLFVPDNDDFDIK